MEPYVKQYQKGPCGILEFGNPAGNSLPGNLLKKLHQHLVLLEADKSVKVILLQSAGTRAFCGGASFAEMKQLKTLETATEFFMGFANVINALRCSSKFVVARVQGKIVGGGVGLIAACDSVIAHDSASIKLSELSIGIGPYVIEPAVSRRIGTTAFAQLSLEAESWKDATWAMDKGLYTQVVSTEESLDEGVMKTCLRLAKYSPDATKNLRKLHWKDTEHWKTLLPKNAKITASLVLEKTTQNILKSI